MVSESVIMLMHKTGPEQRLGGLRARPGRKINRQACLISQSAGPINLGPRISRAVVSFDMAVLVT